MTTTTDQETMSQQDSRWLELEGRWGELSRIAENKLNEARQVAALGTPEGLRKARSLRGQAGHVLWNVRAWKLIIASQRRGEDPDFVGAFKAARRSQTTAVPA